MLAQIGGDDLGPMLWVVAMLVISLISWIAAKIKEWSDRGGGKQQEPQEEQARTEPDEEPVVDLRKLLGLPPEPPEAPQRTQPEEPPAARAPDTPRPIARPAGQVPPQPSLPRVDRTTPPLPHVPPKPERVVVISATPEPPPPAPPSPRIDSVRELVAEDLTATPVSTPAPVSAKRRVRVTRAEMRRAVVLAEILDKPVALRDLEG